MALRVQDQGACSICLWPINEDAVQLACGHYFHGRCVAQMRCHNVSSMCPLCRMPLSELRTVSSLLDEVATLGVRAAAAAGMSQGGSFHGVWVPDVNLQSVTKDMLELAREAHTLDPTNWDAQFWLGEGLTWCRLYADAKAHYLHVLETNPSRPGLYTIHHVLGQTLFELQEYDAGFVHLHQAVYLNPHWCRPHTFIGMKLLEAYILRGHRDSACLERSEYHLAEGVRLDPEDQCSRLNFGTGRTSTTNSLWNET